MYNVEPILVWFNGDLLYVYEDRKLICVKTVRAGHVDYMMGLYPVVDYYEINDPRVLKALGEPESVPEQFIKLLETLDL